MQVVMFTVADADGRDEILSQISRAFDGAKVERLFPGSAQADLEADYFIALDPECDVERVAKALCSFPGVSGVSVPASRKLVAGIR